MVRVIDMRDGSAEAVKEVEWKNSLSQFLNKRVEIEYGRTNDLMTSAGTMRGWLQEYDGGLILVKRRGSSRFTRLTGGLFDGFYATVTVNSIKEV